MPPAIGLKREIGVAEALSELRPGTSWVIRDGDYEGIEWHSDEAAKPTQEEINEKMAELVSAEPVRVLREIRDWYLKESDWTQGYDIRQLRGAEWCAAWDEYRQQLRELPSVSNPYFNEYGNIAGADIPERPNVA